MCGIFGVVDKKKAFEKESIRIIVDTMIHRGPNGGGVYLSECKSISFAHRRLSIIDLSENAKQPMIHKSGKYVVTYNGELYNFAEIRESLVKKGYSFSSKSDTEVILKSYIEWGYDCLKYFNGMFAFAILDHTKNIIFMARDRAGEKPLFYFKNNTSFAFSSELKAIMKWNNDIRKIDKDSLDHYLAFGYSPKNMTMLKGVKKLASANAMVYDLDAHNLKKWKYWQIPNYSKIFFGNEEEYLDRLEILLKDSIKKQLVADVPVGVLLSGGIDSSIVTALATKVSKSIKTFTITFPGHKKYDESNHANLISEYFGTDHLELPLPKIKTEVLSQLAKQYDEPLTDSSMIPTYFVSKLVKQHCDVALGGDGADELFGGYSHYSRLLWTKKYLHFMPLFMKNILAQSATRYLPLGFKGRNWFQSLASDLTWQLPLIASYFDKFSRKKLLLNQTEFNFNAELTREDQISKNQDFVQRLTRSDFSNYLSEDILVKVDRASMLNSLEVRAPFLDYRIIEFAFSNVPSELKTSTRDRKIILKKFAKKILPKQINLKRKQGFSVPLDSWLKETTWLNLFKEVLLASNDPIFNSKFVEGLFKGQQKGLMNSERLFSLVLFELWREEYNVTI